MRDGFLSCSGIAGCKRGESLPAHGGELQVSSGASPGAGHVSLQRPGLSLRPVRGYGARIEPRHRGIRQVHLRRDVPFLQQDQNPGHGD